MMKQISRFNVVLLQLLLAIVAACESASRPIIDSELAPTTFRETDLVGTWEGHYSLWDTDRLILREDRKFKQIYKDGKDYVYETPWNKWWIERFPDGRVWVHLEGARYYPNGTGIAEEEGIIPFRTWEPQARHFYDPFAEEQEPWVEMVRKIVLNVRRISSGELVLVHMSGSANPPTWESLVRVSITESPSLLQTPAP